MINTSFLISDHAPFESYSQSTCNFPQYQQFAIPQNLLKIDTLYLYYQCSSIRLIRSDSFPHSYHEYHV